MLYVADAPGQGHAQFAATDLVSRSQSLMPGARIVQTDWLTQYDEYWYSREHRESSRALPVLRVRFDDPAATWYHIAPQTGQVVERLTRANRLQRWLYNGLHSLDFRFLLRHRPAWDIVMIVLALMGFFLSVSGIVVGVRRLFRKRSRKTDLTNPRHPLSKSGPPMATTRTSETSIAAFRQQVQ
jgi:hypothetical protein